jgi:hypothetical protein
LDNAIGHIEHYANSGDYVSQIGVLHFGARPSPKPVAPGENVLRRSQPDPVVDRGQNVDGKNDGKTLGQDLSDDLNATGPSKTRFMGRIFVAPASGHLLNQHYLHSMFPLTKNDETTASTNAFMEMEVDGTTGDNEQWDHQLAESQWEGVRQSFVRKQVGVIGESPVVDRTAVKVKDLSRLWAYRNGGSPDDSVRRVSTA